MRKMESERESVCVCVCLGVWVCGCVGVGVGAFEYVWLCVQQERECVCVGSQIHFIHTLTPSPGHRGADQAGSHRSLHHANHRPLPQAGHHSNRPLWSGNQGPCYGGVHWVGRVHYTRLSQDLPSDGETCVCVWRTTHSQLPETAGHWFPGGGHWEGHHDNSHTHQ